MFHKSQKLGIVIPLASQARGLTEVEHVNGQMPDDGPVPQREVNEWLRGPDGDLQLSDYALLCRECLKVAEDGES